jgi:hypothetical protein
MSHASSDGRRRLRAAHATRTCLTAPACPTPHTHYLLGSNGIPIAWPFMYVRIKMTDMQYPDFLEKVRRPHAAFSLSHAALLSSPAQHPTHARKSSVQQTHRCGCIPHRRPAPFRRLHPGVIQVCALRITREATPARSAGWPHVAPLE